jgi:hypothetical protein
MSGLWTVGIVDVGISGTFCAHSNTRLCTLCTLLSVQILQAYHNSIKIDTCVKDLCDLLYIKIVSFDPDLFFKSGMDIINPVLFG